MAGNPKWLLWHPDMVEAKVRCDFDRKRKEADSKTGAELYSPVCYRKENRCSLGRHEQENRLQKK